MQQMLEFLNQNAGGLSALFSALVTLATVIYAGLTALLVSETRRLRQAQTEPRVQIIYRLREEWIALTDIVIRNIGLGPAYEVRFTISPTGASDAETPLRDELLKVNAFAKGLSYLGPGQEFASHWTILNQDHERKIRAALRVTASYKSATGASYTTDHLLDLSEVKGLHQIGNQPPYKIAKALEELQKDIHHLATGFRRLRVETFDRADRETELAEIMRDEVDGQELRAEDRKAL